MNYLLFNNNIYLSDGSEVKRIEKGLQLKSELEGIDEASICVVDVDVLLAAAVEYPQEKKDCILVRKFKELYQHEPYIIQDERIDNNLFQVIGIKEQKVREVYSLIPQDKVRSFIPYGIALRNTLINKNVNLKKTVVFVDDLETERLLTVFDGLRFSRTRVIANNEENILTEIKRSQIDFFKKTEEFLSKKSVGFVIIVNNQALAAEISKNTEKLQVEYLDVAYPAIEGLKVTDSLIKYRLPEENLKKRREIELKKRVITSIISLCLVTSGLIFLLFNKLEFEAVKNRYTLAKQSNERLNEQLKIFDKETYREDLKVRKSLNYGISYFSILEIIPSSYTVNSFRFYKTNKWNVEMTLFADGDRILGPIPRIRVLKNAKITDIFVNNQPGKYLRVTL